ncbi:MAG: pyridine nucleotide-disulfide oxidoreductase, partial [Erythrobacter sp.]|nr:pyridine nucleotide-disulfide oxidoreductase [Erythrobacter sp.]
ALDPDLAGKTAIVVGAGNVALDLARILAKTEEEFAGSDIVGHALDALGASGLERIVILSRRGPHAIQMTPKELGELGELEDAVPFVDAEDLPPSEQDETLEPGRRKSVQLLRDYAKNGSDQPSSKRLRIEFHFFASPIGFSGNGKVSSVTVERTRIEDGRALGTGETYDLPADLVVSCIGYRTSPIDGVPFDERAGRFANEGGRILPGLYCVGWARRGPSGTIGTNRPDGYAIVDRIGENIGSCGGSDKPGRAGFDALAAQRELDVITFRDWQRIEEAEIAAARKGSPREKFVDVASMIAAGGRESAK